VQNPSIGQATQELLGDDVIQAINLISEKSLSIGIRAMKHLQNRLKRRYPSGLEDDETENMENIDATDEALGDEEFGEMIENAVSRVSTTKRTKEEEWRKLIVSLISA